MPFRRSSPVYVAAAAGAAYTSIWRLAGEPDIHLSRWFVPATLVIGVVAAATGPRPLWPARAAPWFAAGLIASMTASLLAAVAQVANGERTLGSAAGVIAVDVIGLAFFGGAALWMARLHRPSRRLAPEVLARIPPPAATRRVPLRLTAQLADGSRRSVVVLEGGYLGGRRSPPATEIVAFEPPPGDTEVTSAGARGTATSAESRPTHPVADAPVVTVVPREPRIRAAVGAATVPARGRTLGEALAHLAERLPSDVPLLADDGSLDSELVLYLGNPNRPLVRDRFTRDLARELSAGSSVAIYPAATAHGSADTGGR